MNKDLPYYVGFSHFFGIGPIRFSRLLARFETVQAAYEADKHAIQETIGLELGAEFVEFRSTFNAEKKCEEFRKKHIVPLTIEDDEYPPQLADIPDPPICLYAKGAIDRLDFKNGIFVGIVGTRKPSHYGEQITELFARGLAQAGCIIVSGLALGIDAIAHKTALAEHTKTVAFLGCGVDLKYPPSNGPLYDEILATGGCIISEFPPGMYVQKGLFVARNRLVSGLSRGVLVIEGTEHSGSLITARCAAEQGKEVFAPPVPLTSRNSEAPNILIKEGAKFVTSAADILDYLHLKFTPQETIKKLQLTPDEQTVYELLLAEPRLPDSIAIERSATITETLSTLSSLEIKGAVRKIADGSYEICIS